MPTVSLIGVPWDAGSSYQRGTGSAPAAIRSALWSPSSNSSSESGVDLSADGVLQDEGDLVLPSEGPPARAAIELATRRTVAAGRRPLLLGGDHSITYPALRGMASKHPSLTVLHLDAHGDLYDHFPLGKGLPVSDGRDEQRYSHACPFARVMEEGLATRLLQVGVRTLTAHQRQQVQRFGVEVFAAARWREALAVIAALQGDVYVSLDVDVLEPALAPGLSHPEAGGLTVREVLEVLAAVRARLVGADLVEYNPQNDVRDLTARVAAKFVKELVATMTTSAA